MNPTLRTLACAFFCLLVAAPLRAQPYPAKPVRIVVPFAPGGGSDFIGRFIAQKLSERLGQQFVVDNRPGAGGNLGAEMAIKSAGDGYTLFIATAETMALNPFIYTVTPNTGSNAGGLSVVITGANFTDVNTVKFGGAIATFTLVNSTTIHATTPAYPITGIVDVSAISPFGTGTSHGAFTYT